MFDPAQFREHVVRPALTTIGMYSPAAEDLIVGTCAAESTLGTFLRQKGGGPALGVMEVEKATHDDVWLSWLRYRADEAAVLRSMVAPCWWDSARAMPRAEVMVSDLAYNIAIARYVYRRAKPPLPHSGDWSAMAAYWVLHYNKGGAGTTRFFLEQCAACGVL